MIKLIGTGVWVCVVTLASVYFSVQMSNQVESADDVPELMGKLHTVRGEITTIPVISDGAVQGYFLSRLSFTADPDLLENLSIAPNELITDVLYSQLVGNNVINFPSLENFDLDTFREGIKVALNKRVGSELFHDVIIEQIDYLAKEDIRANMRKGAGQSMTGASKPLVKGESQAADDGSSAPTH